MSPSRLVIATVVGVWLLFPLGVAPAAAAAGAENTAPVERPVEDVRLEVRKTERGARVEAENLRRVAYELRIENRSSDGAAAEYRVVPAQATTTIFELDGLSREEAIAHVRETYRIVSFMGDPAAIDPDEDHLYRLPFRAGKSYRLSQGFHGKQSHDLDTSRYALDFQLEVGEPVHAAREGLVVKVVDGFHEAGDRSLQDKANLIIVLHDDGTMAHYVHLDRDGSLVEEGDRVERGQPIGVSGMTGFTRGPHLHFVVRRERDIAVPVQFEGHEGKDLSKPGKFRIGATPKR